MDDSLPVKDRLERDCFGLGRLSWCDAVNEPDGIGFNLPMPSCIRLFGDIGHDGIDYIEVRAPESATGANGTVTAECEPFHVRLGQTVPQTVAGPDLLRDLYAGN